MKQSIKIPLHSKKYPGLFATIDADDYDLVSQYRWSRSHYGYAVSHGSRLIMHRLVMGAINGKVVHHHDKDRLNNQKANLEILSKTKHAILHLTGKPCSEETKEKIRNSLIGLEVPMERRLKYKNNMLNRWKNMSDSEKGKIFQNLRHDWTEESRERVSKAHRGRKRHGSTSKFRGVSWFKRDACWRAWIKYQQKQKHLGYFHNEIEAAKAYNEAAKKYFKEFAYLNIF